jgi:Tfp pilus assembly protein PilF
LALNKGKVSKPAQSYFLLAYLAYEMKKLDEALQYVQKSLKLDPHSKDAQNFEKTVKDSISERDSNKADANKTT